MKNVIKCIVIIIAFLFVIVITINYYVVLSTKKQIITEYDSLDNIDCIIVLGAGVWGDKPSHMLEDRLLTAIELYKRGVAPKIIMSGDHGKVDYDEVNIMKNYAIKAGVPSEDIFMDHAGFSTYESMYRAKDIFKAQNVVIVTQEYHLHRALYIANKLDLKAYGVSADKRTYRGQKYRDFRELLARNKDFFQTIIKPEPTYLGETIPVSGNGDITNDK